MKNRDEELALDDAALLSRCDLHLYKASGPGGQHRNKVTSAVRLRHTDTGITVTAAESRSQHDNRRRALRRMRQKLACQLRRSFRAADALPEPMRACIFLPKGALRGSPGRVEVGRKDARFWSVAAILLDALDAADGRVGQAAAALGVTTGSLVRVLRSDRHLLSAAQQIRRGHDKGPLR